MDLYETSSLKLSLPLQTNNLLFVVVQSSDNKRISLEFNEGMIELACDLLNYVSITVCMHSKIKFRNPDTGALIHEQDPFYTNKLEIILEKIVLVAYRCESHTYEFSDTGGFLGLIGHRGSGQDKNGDHRGSGQDKNGDHRGSGQDKNGDHRGSGQDKNGGLMEYKENTLISFRNALSKIDWIEFDVQLSDDIPVIYHDFYIKESGNPVNSKDSIKYFKEDDHLPPTLEYVLKNVKGGLNIEIKNQVGDLSGIPNLVDRILNVIYKNDYRKIIFSSFHPFVLMYLKMRVPHARILLIYGKDNEHYDLKDSVTFCIRNNLSGMVFEYGTLDDEALKILEYNKKDVYVYDVVSKEEYAICKEKNIKGIITDEIDLLK
jgi:glycerophosphodiester phosphodiesterase